MLGLAPGGEAGCSPGVGFAGVRVPDMGGEELDDAAGGIGIGRKERREPSLADRVLVQIGLSKR